jgi:ribosomal protein S18 acetylase RimI-like enzyme
VSQPKITVATVADRDRVLRSLVAAFAGDPAVRMMLPDDATYPERAAGFFGWLFDRRVGGKSVWAADGGAAVAIWESPDTAAADVPAGNLELPAEDLARIKAYDKAVHHALPPQPYWYLGVLGTDPAFAGRRWGRLVMAEGLRAAARAGLPAVLETSNPGNVEVYRRSGWAVLHRVDAGELPVWVMQQRP